MSRHASVGLLHSYLNILEHPTFFTDERFRDAFLSPLLVTLLAFAMGSPVRVVDARAKDAGPLEARAQDNMLHIDNTPFNDEFKVLLLWRRGRPEGPVGQNFTYLPGTHRAFRNAKIAQDGQPYSTENASIFVTDDSVEKLFAVQQRISGTEGPLVVEISDPDRPLTVLFAAGSLVHHRYRTAGGAERSCMIVAFHPATAEPGRRMPRRSLVEHLLASKGDADERDFIKALGQHSVEIADQLSRVTGPGSIVIEPRSRRLQGDALGKWLRTVAHAPEIEDLKKRAQRYPFENWITASELAVALGPALMFYDKHGPLDLVLYADSHEEVRKWARNRIREMPLDTMSGRLRRWHSAITKPSETHLLSSRQLDLVADRLIAIANNSTSDERGRSIKQLLVDLREALARPYSIQNLLSTGLFLFWCGDELVESCAVALDEVRHDGGRLLRHYIALALIARAIDVREGQTSNLLKPAR